MTKRRTVDADAAERPVARIDPGRQAAIAHRMAGAHSLQEAEERYVVARDAWVVAMRAANSGKPADMASLAIAQEAYELAVEERERWLSGKTVAIPVDPEAVGHDRDLNAAIAHELAWRVVLDSSKPAGLLGRIRRRLGGK